MTATPQTTYDGGCTCRHVRYRMTSNPLFVHCCHCRWCQRETGSAFVLNAMIEADRVQLLHGDVEVVDTPSLSGKGQKIARCPKCRIALWSNYGGGGDSVRFVRVGTLDEPDRLPPDVHIFGVEAAVGRPASGNAGVRGVLPAARSVAGGEPCTARGAARGAGTRAEVSAGDVTAVCARP